MSSLRFHCCVWGSWGTLPPPFSHTCHFLPSPRFSHRSVMSVTLDQGSHGVRRGTRARAGAAQPGWGAREGTSRLQTLEGAAFLFLTLRRKGSSALKRG